MADNFTFNSTPSAQMYGVFPQAAAQMAVSDPNNPMYIGTYGLAKKATRDYEAAMARAQEVEAAISADNNRAGIAKEYLQQASNLADKGVSSYLAPNTGGYLNIDQQGMRQSDQVHLDKTVAGSFKDRAEGVEKITSATGRTPTEEQIQQIYAGPLGNYLDLPEMPQTQPTAGETKAKEADAALQAAQARMYSAQHGKGAGDGTVIVTNSVVGPDGNLIPISVQTKEKPGNQAPTQDAAPTTKPPVRRGGAQRPAIDERTGKPIIGGNR